MVQTPGPLYREKHRPGFHFTPPENWINDPNGLVWYDGLYHLFYQHNPYDKVWGAMHWGHAVSHDLLHWENRPIALKADHDGLGFVFSGSAVVDKNNTSGFQDGKHPPLVAIFTHHTKYDEQMQSLAYSTDGGTNWQMYDSNPVIENLGIADFRDPKVFWCEQSCQWIMALAAGTVIQFFGSPNLREWEFLSDFGKGIGIHDGVWECPDLFELPVEGTDERRWILLVSVGSGAPNGGSATQYFVGNFDGQKFTPDHTQVLWMDYGPDNYAAVSWSDIPIEDGRRIVVGWMNNWDYANKLPTAPWRGALTIPRELRLIQNRNGIRLAAEPVSELGKLRNEHLAHEQDIELRDALVVYAGSHLPDKLDLEMTIGWANGASEDWALQFFNSDGEALTFDFRVSLNQLTVDRSGVSSGIETTPEFLREISAPIDLGRLQEMGIRILKDTSSLELFLDDGRSLLTLNYYSKYPLDQLRISSRGAEHPLIINSLDIHALNGTWEQK